MNNKKIKMVILGAILLLAVFLIKMEFRIEPKKYVYEQQGELSIAANGLIEKLEKKIDIYRTKSECPNIKNKDKIYDLSVEQIAVEKYKEYMDVEYEDRVIIFLKNRPEDEGYLNCGIYYSPNNCTIDYYGHAVEEDENGIFVYDGEPKGMRIKYKSERICDNWFYFQESVWN